MCPVEGHPAHDFRVSHTVVGGVRIAATSKKPVKKAAKKAAKKPARKKAAPKKAAKKPAAKKAAKKPAAKKSARKTRAKKAAAPLKAPRKKTTRSPDLDEAARALAALALLRAKQGGQLNVRQREELRRALARAAENLSWNVMAASTDEPVVKASKDVMNLVTRGAKSIAEDLATELANKKTEMTVLGRTHKAIHKLADKHDFEEPAEITYTHTARDGVDGYQTNTETLTFATATEARDEADKIEKKMDSWNKLREAMLVDLKQKQKQVAQLPDTQGAFVESTRTLLRDVFATLH